MHRTYYEGGIGQTLPMQGDLEGLSVQNVFSIVIILGAYNIDVNDRLHQICANMYIIT